MKNPSRFATVSILVVTCLSITAPAVPDDGSREARPPVKVMDVARPGDASRGILQYDDGVPVYRDGATGPNILVIGNKFSAGLPPSGPYTVTAASVNLAGLYAGQFWMGFFKSASHATDPLGVIAWRGVLATGTGWNSVLFATPVISTGPFLAGIINFGLPPCTGNTGLGTTCEGVALGPGTNNGLGHNAIRISLATSSATVGSQYATIPGQNALIRLNGPTIPVELMRFEIE